MKNLLTLTLMLLLLSTSAYPQTVVNFNVPDCNGVNYDLFENLDAGKVVVIGWTMPCGSCVLPLKTTYNVVQSYQENFPDRVQMLLADDYANTPCNTINLWANSNGMVNTLRFSNQAIKMMDYGSNGMPKVVVVGGPDRRVYYNADDAVDHAALQEAIDNAISTITGIHAPAINRLVMKVFPNPAGDLTNISFQIEHPDQVSINLTNQTGQEIMTLFKGEVSAGLHNFELNTSELQSGIYFLRLQNAQGIHMKKLSVVH